MIKFEYGISDGYTDGTFDLFSADFTKASRSSL